MTATARIAHYILPPRMMLERHDLGSRDYEVHTMQRPYAQYAEPVCSHPTAPSWSRTGRSASSWRDVSVSR